MNHYVSRSADRIFSIVEFINAAMEPLGLSDIARGTGLHRATAYRFLSVLEEKGYIYKDPASGAYSVGQKLFRLGTPQVRTVTVIHRVRPLVRRLAYSTDMTATIGMIEGTQIVICEKVETPRSLKTFPLPGAWLDAHATALGKAILAFRPQDEVREAYRRHRLHSYTENTITRQDALFANLEIIRREGHAYDFAEMIAGTHCVAAPMINSRGYAIYALSLSGPYRRYPKAKLAEAAVQLKQTISEMRKLIFNRP
ncbi:MAG: IclR family transcriptional regulator [Betaproteobacteria bacterium]|nr:IclR family transcriptional regulator [Betaproteobacteria bacterium]